MDVRKTKILTAAFLLLVGALMVSLSWLKWPDILVDFGREVYVPWRMTEGDILYRDIHYWNGPLSPYINFVIFSLFKESILAIEAINLLVIAGITYLAYRLFNRAGDRASAISVCTVFLTIFAFAQYYWTGNFNFVAPYSHELTHGTLIAFAALFFLMRYLDERSLKFMGGLGLCAGLALLTKIEITLGVAAAAFTGFALTLWHERPVGVRFFSLISIFFAGLIMPVIFFAVVLGSRLGIGEAFDRMFGTWLIITGTDISSGKFQRDVMGVDDVGGNLLKMFKVTLWWFLLAIPLAANYFWRRSAFFKTYGGFLSFIVCAAVLFYFMKMIPWTEIMRPLPLFVIVIAIFQFVRFLFNRDDRDEAVRAVPMVAFAAFAFVMLLKMILNVQVAHYGFALAMPATLLMVHALLALAPQVVDRSFGFSGIFRSAGFAFVAFMVVSYVNASARVYAMKTYRVNSGHSGDVIVSYDPRIKPEGMAVDMALKEVEDIMAPDETFLVLPEGVMLNFLSRRVNPTGYINFVPSELTIFKEERMLASFEAKPPDYVILAHKDTSDYGPRFFGRDYGRLLYSWVAANYTPIRRIGAMPLVSDRFGILILKHSREKD